METAGVSYYYLATKDDIYPHKMKYNTTYHKFPCMEPTDLKKKKKKELEKELGGSR